MFLASCTVLILGLFHISRVIQSCRRIWSPQNFICLLFKSDTPVFCPDSAPPLLKLKSKAALTPTPTSEVTPCPPTPSIQINHRAALPPHPAPSPPEPRQLETAKADAPPAEDQNIPDDPKDVSEGEVSRLYSNLFSLPPNVRTRLFLHP